MECKKYESWLLRSWDGRLSPEEKEKLEEHLKACSPCQQREREYRELLFLLKEAFPEPQPYFWERLEGRLRKEKEPFPWFLRKEWALRAVVFSFGLAILFISLMFFFAPSNGEDLSQAEILLLRNENPLSETRPIFEEERLEKRNWYLIFSVMEEKATSGRRLP